MKRTPKRSWLPEMRMGGIQPKSGGDSHWRHLAAGTMAGAAGQWLMLWLLARTAEPELVGLYGLALAWITPVFAFCALQLRPLLATETRIEERLAAFQRMRWLGLATSALAALGVAAWGAQQNHFAGVIIGVALLRGAEMLSDFTYGLRTQRGELRAVGRSQLLRSIVMVDVFGILWIVGGSLPAALLASGCAAVAVALWLDREGLTTTTHLGKPGFWQLPVDDLHSRAILRVALPLAAVMFLNQAIVAAPRILMGWWLNLEALAKMSCLMSLLVLPGMLASSYAAGLSRRFVIAADEGSIAVWLLARQAAGCVLCASLPAAALLIAVGGVIMKQLFGSAYQVDRLTLGGAALFGVTWAVASVFGTAATAARQVLPQAVAFALALVTCVSVAALLIPQMGLAGATLSLGAAGLVLVMAYLIRFQQDIAGETSHPGQRKPYVSAEERTADA